MNVATMAAAASSGARINNSCANCTLYNSINQSALNSINTANSLELFTFTVGAILILVCVFIFVNSLDKKAKANTEVTER